MGKTKTLERVVKYCRGCGEKREFAVRGYLTSGKPYLYARCDHCRN